MNIKTFAKNNWFGLVSLIVSLIILYIFLLTFGGWRAFVASVAGMDFFWLAATVACVFLFWLTDGIILHLYIKTKYKEHRFVSTFKTTAIGFLYNCLTPFASGGQPMQVYDMAKGGVDAGDAASYITVKSIVYQICLTVFAVVSAIFTLRFFNENIPHFIWFFAVGIAVNAAFVAAAFVIIVNKAAATKLGMFFLKILVRLRIVKNKEKAVDSLNKHISLFNESFQAIYQKKWLLASSFLVTLIQLALYYSLPYFIYRGFHLSGGAFGLMVSAQAILTLITAFFPMPGSSGAVETGFYFFFEMFFAYDAIMPAMIIWRMLTYYLCIIGGGAVSLLGMVKRK
ncbi:MAG: flippase-like domain-containing protein [Clostridiales bacterium]|jgi:uncharacterized protein (TIRG00374 family)|nr:flippase-like domain-containing protein [Clostridiales bacterium]